MKRVMIVGGSGSGKSTLARLMSARTGLPVIHLDQIYWTPGWIERDEDERDRMIHEGHMLDAWIIEGGASRTCSERAARADTLIWLDMPAVLRLWRVMRRTLVFLGRSRPDLPGNCQERISRETLRFYTWLWRTRHSGREAILRIAGEPPARLAVHHLRGLRAVRAFLAHMEPVERAVSRH